MTKRVLPIVLIAVAVLLAGGMSPDAAQTAESQPSVQIAVSIPYSGSLTNETGQPVANGTYGFTFELFAVESGEEPLWTEIQPDVVVDSGNFVASLGSITPLSKAALTLDTLWLEVAVRGPGESVFTTLTPRQPLSARVPVSPASLSAGPSCAHDHVNEVWSANTAWSNGAFKVLNYGNGPSIWGWNGGNGNGVRGYALSTGYGVYGESVNSYGVFGRSTTGFGIGIAGGGDTSFTDAVGDLLLEGQNGEIFANGSGGMDLNSNYDIRMHLDRDNNNSNEWFSVFNGEGTNVFYVTQIGDIVANGSKAGYVVDVALNDDAVSLETGDVVIISGSGSAVVGEIPVIKVRLAATESTSAVIGVVDKVFVAAVDHDASTAVRPTEASYVANAIAPGEYLTIVTLGSFKAIKVDASYGGIAPGDLLVTSPNPGHAMRATSPAPGTIIGKALDALESGIGVIPVIVTMQ